MIEVIDHDFSGNSAKVLQGTLVATEEVLRGLGNGELRVHHTAVCQQSVTYHFHGYQDQKYENYIPRF